MVTRDARTAPGGGDGGASTSSAAADGAPPATTARSEGTSLLTRSRWPSKPLRKRARILYGTSSAVLSSAFVLLPYAVLRLGPTLAAVLVLSAAFVGYYASFHLTAAHAVSGAPRAQTTFPAVVSSALRSTAISPAAVRAWHLGAVAASVAAPSTLAGATLREANAGLCNGGAACSDLSVSAWILVFTSASLLAAAVEPLRRGMLLLQAAPGCLALLAILSMVLTDIVQAAQQDSSTPTPPAGQNAGASCDDQGLLGTQDFPAAIPAASIGAVAFVMGNQYLLPDAITSLGALNDNRGTALVIVESSSVLHAMVVVLYIPLAYLSLSAYSTCLKPSVLGNTTGQPIVRLLAIALLTIQIMVDVLVRENSLHQPEPITNSIGQLTVFIRRVALLLSCGVAAALLPLSFSLAGIAGGLFVVPIAVILPSMISQSKSAGWLGDPLWLLNISLMVVCGVFALIATVGSLYLVYVLGSQRWEAIISGNATFVNS